VEEKGLEEGEGVPALSLSLPLFLFRLFARAKYGERRKKATAR
jgi:hypothetical protein